VEWIPKIAIPESFRLSTRVLSLQEIEEGILKENSQSFFDTKLRELSCKKVKKE